MNAHSKNGELVLWRFSDNKAGHDAQSKGLTQALGNLTPCSEYVIPVPGAVATLISLISKHCLFGANLPSPDLVIGAGHKTHLPLLATKRCRGGQTVVLMRPSLPSSWFDYCIVPAHDNPSQRDNIIISEGPLNTITPSNSHQRNQGLVLIGGPSKHFDWDQDLLLQQIDDLLQDKRITWAIADSRRTPLATRVMLKQINNSQARYFPYEQCSQGWLNNQLSIAGQAWVSEDSVSMVYEALTAGVVVGLISVPQKQNSRVARAMNNFKQKKLVMTLDCRDVFPAPVTFNESVRCAEALILKLNLK